MHYFAVHFHVELFYSLFDCYIIFRLSLCWWCVFSSQKMQWSCWNLLCCSNNIYYLWELPLISCHIKNETFLSEYVSCWLAFPGFFKYDFQLCVLFFFFLLTFYDILCLFAGSCCRQAEKNVECSYNCTHKIKNLFNVIYFNNGIKKIIHRRSGQQSGSSEVF